MKNILLVIIVSLMFLPVTIIYAAQDENFFVEFHDGTCLKIFSFAAKEEEG